MSSRADAYNHGPCQSWNRAESRECGEPGKRFLPGLRCPAHEPAVVAGRTVPVPDPDRTLDGLRRVKGGVDAPAPMGASAGIDRAAIASGKRRSSPEAYAEARR